MSELKKKTVIRLFFTIWSIMTVIALFVMIIVVYKLGQENSVIINSVINTAPKTVLNNSTSQLLQHKSINVYVFSKKGICLHPIEIQIEWKPSYQENCKQVLNAIRNIKLESYISPLPEDINLRGIYLTPECELIIDLPAVIISKFKKNTTAFFETLFTYSIVNSLLQKELTGNNTVKGVKFLVEGSVPTGEFPKHISWLQLVTPDYSLICNE